MSRSAEEPMEVGNYHLVFCEDFVDREIIRVHPVKKARE